MEIEEQINLAFDAAVAEGKQYLSQLDLTYEEYVAVDALAIVLFEFAMDATLSPEVSALKVVPCALAVATKLASEWEANVKRVLAQIEPVADEDSAYQWNGSQFVWDADVPEPPVADEGAGK